MYEKRDAPPITIPGFGRRLALHGLLVAGIVLAALGIGVAGYMGLGGLAWDDAILNASMILGGMGPVDPLHSTSAKLFASAYALFSGVIFIAVAGILLAPVAHFIMHRFHWEEPGDDSGDS